MVRSIRQGLLTACLVALVMASLSGCDSVLQEDPKTFQNPDNYYSTATELRAAANGIYRPLLTYGGFKFPLWADSACDSDVTFCPPWFGSGMSGSDWQGEFWTQGSNSSWSAFYQVIAQANTLLQNAPDASVDQDVLDEAMGQAYFLRGYAYFGLGLRYGDAPIRDELYNPSQGGFGDAARDPVHEVWLQAVSDLKAAAERLPPDYVGYQRGRPTAVAAEGMLAKAYLHMAGKQFTQDRSEEEWYDEYLANNRQAYVDSARIWAGRVVEQAEMRSFPSLEDDYMALFDEATQDQSNEMLFTIQMSQHSDGSNDLGPQGSEIPQYYNPNGPALDGTSFHGGLDLGAVFFRYQWVQQQDSTDERFDVGTAFHDAWIKFGSDTTYTEESLPEDPNGFSFSGECDPDLSSTLSGETIGGVVWYTSDAFCDIVYPDGATSFIRVTPGYFTRKYVSPGAASKVENQANLIVLRYADVVLIYAEALARSGRTGEAIEQLNKVRERAGASTYAGVGDIDAPSLEEAIWAERLRELYGEQDRRWDLLRQGRFFEQLEAVGKSRPPRRRLLPLPDVEVNGNAEIAVNNPGY